MPSDETTESCCGTCRSWQKVPHGEHEAPAGICRRIPASSVVAISSDAAIAGEGVLRTGERFCCLLYHRIGDMQWPNQ